MKARKPVIEAELSVLYRKHGYLRPKTVVDWARGHPRSALHGRFQWNDSKAAEEYRLWQARELITEVHAVYPDMKARQVYVSPLELRTSNAGYVALVDVMKNEELRTRFLAQALTEYRRLGEKYHDLRELAGVRSEVEKLATQQSR